MQHSVPRSPELDRPDECIHTITAGAWLKVRVGLPVCAGRWAVVCVSVSLVLVHAGVWHGA